VTVSVTVFDYRVIEEETGRAEADQPGIVTVWFGYGKRVFLV
jgi:hypothetical protein